MIIHPAEQGSAAWTEARLGIPTASEFSRILTPTGKLSASRDGYLAELLAEWALGEAVTEFLGTDWTERAHILEPQARAAYGLLRDADVTKCGLCYLDESRMVGASPDGLVGDDGLLELKVPKASTHLMWLARDAVPKDHAMQLQGQLWVTDRKWVDFMSYHPGLPPLILRVEHDEKIQAALTEHIPRFVDDVIQARARLRDLGVVPALETVGR